MAEVIKHILILLSFAAFSTGLIKIRKTFYDLTCLTTGLLDIMLEKSIEDLVKQQKLILQTKRVVKEMLIFLSLFLFVSILAFLPLITFHELDVSPSSYTFVIPFITIIVAISGSIIPIFIFLKRDRERYSASSKLLHHIALDHFNISRNLFALEKKLYVSKIRSINPDYVIVSGLARSGTTALTNLLYQHGNFSSLSYENMPFLMNPVTWKKIYRPRTKQKLERTHGDRIMVNHKSIEAFEEYFFKVHLRDAFITEAALQEHELNPNIYHQYLCYIHLIKKRDAYYLAKNNNLILRYRSLRKFNPYFKALFMFREPIEHATSLWTQHQNFIQQQNDDPFILTYMNWLCHHEFGLNHKPFYLSNQHFHASYAISSVNYWIEIWIYYYQELLKIVQEETGNKMFLIHYEDLLNSPRSLLTSVGKALEIPFSNEPIPVFTSGSKTYSDLDTSLLEKAKIIYEKLMKLKFSVT